MTIGFARIPSPEMAASAPLSVENLVVAFEKGTRPVVRGVSFEVRPAEAMGLVGESGCGKSLTLRAILGLLPPGARASGRITYADYSLLELPERALRKLRGSRIGMVFQDPMTALNPVLRVGDAIAQVVTAHEQVGASVARRRATEMMERVGIQDAARLSHEYPHEFSGGMRQRIVIAMALAGHPSLLLADEPTTALDVIVQGEVLGIIDRLRRENGMSLLLVSHDFAVVGSVCEQIGVMYMGELVEQGATRDVLSRPRHPYTLGLIRSLPEKHAVHGRLSTVPGAPPDPQELPEGCAFAPRCGLAIDDCRRVPIPLLEVTTARRSRCIRWDQVGGFEAAERLSPTEKSRDSSAGTYIGPGDV
jgi:oligopeptide/dipeptide ABC transporter ATP-binding protein